MFILQLPKFRCGGGLLHLIAIIRNNFARGLTSKLTCNIIRSINQKGRGRNGDDGVADKRGGGCRC